MLRVLCRGAGRSRRSRDNQEAGVRGLAQGTHWSQFPAGGCPGSSHPRDESAGSQPGAEKEQTQTAHFKPRIRVLKATMPIPHSRLRGWRASGLVSVMRPHAIPPRLDQALNRPFVQRLPPSCSAPLSAAPGFRGGALPVMKRAPTGDTAPTLGPGRGTAFLATLAVGNSVTSLGGCSVPLLPGWKGTKRWVPSC